MGKYKYLLNNMALFTASNFVSKILVFLLVPFYTSVLTKAQYGTADVMQITLLLLIPLLTGNIGEATLRFALESGNNKSNILRIGLKYTGISIGIVALICGTLVFFVPDVSMKNLILMFLGLYATDCIYEYMLLFCQGVEKVRVMVTGSVLCTAILIISNLFFLLVLKIGLQGYFLSQMISYLFAATLMLIFSGVISYKKSWKKDPVMEKEMVHYGRNMLVYSTSSWANNAFDRYTILFLCGSAVNGIYGVAYKIPAILMIFQRIFAQAWQMSATKAHRETDSVNFFSTMYIMYNAFMILGCSLLIVIVKPLCVFLFQKDFYEAWILVPPLLISVIFGALTGFLGSICLAYKDGKSIGNATGLGAVVNILAGLIGIYYFQAMGAAIVTMISYFVMFFFAYRKVKKHVVMQVHLKKDFVAYGILLIQSACVMLGVPGFYLIDVSLLLLLFVIYGKEVLEIAGKFFRQKASAGNDIG